MIGVERQGLSRGGARDAAVVWLAWLAALAVLVAVAWWTQLVPHHVHPPRGPYDLVHNPVSQGPYWFFFWWDYDWYLWISHVGYAHLGHRPNGFSEAAYGFFPLYPVFLKAAAAIMAPWKLAAVVSILSSAAVFYGLVELRPAVLPAGRVAVALALIPASGSLLLAYPDSFAIACSVWACVAATRRRFGIAAGLGFMAGLARPTSPLIAVALFALLRRERWRVRLAVSAAPLVAVAVVFAFFAYRSGHLLPFRTAQKHWDRTGPLGLVRQIDHMAHGDRVGMILWHQLRREVVILLVVTLPLLVVLARRDWGRLWLPYSLLAVAEPLASGSMGTLSRETLTAFPLVFAAASLKGRVAALAMVAGSAGLVYTVLTYPYWGP